MPNVCDTQKKIIDDIKNQDKAKDRYVRDTLLSWAYIAEDKLKPLSDYMNDKFGDNLDSKQFQESLDKVYGKKENNLKRAITLLSLLQGNEVFWDIAKEYIITNLPQEQKLKFKNGEIELSSLSKGTLNNLLKILGGMAKAGPGDKFGIGFLGKIRMQIGLPQTTALTERTGAFYVSQKAFRGYHTELSQRIEDFMRKPLGRKSKLGYGWLDIAENINKLSDLIDVKWGEEELTERKLMRMFIWHLTGDAFNNTIIKYDEKLEDFVVATSYNATDKFYKGTQDKIHGHFDYVPLKTYKGGKFYLPIAKIKKTVKGKTINPIIEAFKVEGERFRALDDELFDYQEIEFTRSVENIRKAFTSVFGLEGEVLDYALFESLPNKVWKMSKNERAAFIKDLKNTISSKLGPEKLELLEELKNTITGLAVINPYWSELNFEKKRNHFPMVISQYDLPMIFENQIVQFKERIKQNIAAIETVKENPANIMDARATIKALEEDIKEYEARIARNYQLLDNMDEMGLDGAADLEQIPMVQNQKHMKRMTNAVPPKVMRTDMHAFHAALKTQMSAIERNNLITIMIEQLGRAESKPVRAAIINMFKVPFGFTDVESGIGPISFKTDDITRTLGKIGFKIDPKVATEKMKMVNSFISAQMLHGLGTSIQNMSAIQQNIYDYGFRAIKDAIRQYSGPNKEAWKDLVKRSGIIEFRDFFSKSLTSSIISDEIKLDTHNQIMGAIIKYYVRRKQSDLYVGKQNGKKANSAEDQLGKDIVKILTASEDYIAWENNLPSKDRAHARSKRFKRDTLKLIIKKYLNWAIDKEYEFSPVIRKWAVDKHAPAKVLKMTAGTVFQGLNLFVRRTRITMSETESFIRTFSFIIGVRRMQQSNLIERGSPDSLSPEEYNKAMYIGKLFSFNSNFGMTPQDVGSMWWSPAGNMAGKFKIWPMQKLSKDIKSFQKAWRSLYTWMELNENKDKEFKTWVKVLGRFIKTFGHNKLFHGKALREVNSEFAQFRAFFTGQMVMTLLMDVFIFGPAGGTFIRFLANRFGLQSLGGMRSDLLGLLILPAVVAWRSSLDDDDNWEWTVHHILRHTMMGYVPSKLLDITLGMADAIIKSDSDTTIDFLYDSADIFIPLRSHTKEIIPAIRGDRVPF